MGESPAEATGKLGQIQSPQEGRQAALSEKANYIPFRWDAPLATAEIQGSLLNFPVTIRVRSTLITSQETLGEVQSPEAKTIALAASLACRLQVTAQNLCPHGNPNASLQNAQARLQSNCWL